MVLQNSLIVGALVGLLVSHSARAQCPPQMLLQGNVFAAPTEAPGKGLGRAVAGLGQTFPTTVIVGAPLVDSPDAATIGAGRVYLMSLMSFPSPVVVVLDSPTPTANGHFGSAVATAGNSVVVVGAPGERGDGLEGAGTVYRDRKSTRLNSSHLGISYAVFCLKKKNKSTRGKYEERTAMTNTTVRTYFVRGPDKERKHMILYQITTASYLDCVLSCIKT